MIDNADLEVLVYERELAPWWRRPSPTVARRVPPAPGGRGRDPGHGTRPGGGGPRFGARRYEEALAAGTADRDFGPRSPDDLYVLYTGGTTGMPKGVMWRQEDIFFAAMGGGGWGARADHLARRTGRPGQHRRGRPRADAGGRPPHARKRPVGHVERVHDGRHRRALHRAPLRPRPAAAHRRRRAGGVGALVGDAMARPLAEALADRGAGHLRHVHASPSSARAGRCCPPRSRTTSPPSCPGYDHGPLRLQRERRPGRGGGRRHRPPVRDGRGHRGPRRRPAAAVAR